MTIYDDGVEREQIDLSKFNSVSKMHALMAKNGFVKKENELVAEVAIEDQKKAVKVDLKETAIKTASEGNGENKITNKKTRLRRNEKQKSLVKPHIPKTYILLWGGLLCVVFLLLRASSRRRLQRHTV